ncbi:C40 family peptidase [Agathobaculum sp. TL06]
MTDRTRYTGVKTGRTAAQAAQHAKAIRAAQQATQYRMRVKAAGNAVKRAASNAGKALRALLAATRSLMAAAAAGSSVVLSLLIVICIIGLLLTSPFGILFTSEPVDDNSVALNTAIAQINVEYTEKLDELQEGDYDQIIIEGSPPDWREVVAVFAVRTAGTNDGVDVVTLDDDRVDRLRAVFWDMVSLKAEVETTEDDGTILIITIASRTIDEMRELYSFTDRQNNMLDELLDNLELVGGAIGNLDVTDTNAQELLASLPKNLSAERRAVIEAACTLVGKVNYFWGGKSLVIGWDSRWGTTMQVTAAGSSSTGTYRPYGMDCSGYVDWVFYNASGGKYIIGHGGGAASQHTYCSPISWDEALPGDLVFYPGDTHVGIVGGRDTNGNLLIIHCASGYNNVVITGIEGFTSIGRPFYFSD